MREVLQTNKTSRIRALFYERRNYKRGRIIRERGDYKRGRWKERGTIISPKP